MFLMNGESYNPKYFKAAYTRKAGHPSAFRNPSTPSPKVAALPMKYTQAPMNKTIDRTGRPTMMNSLGLQHSRSFKTFSSSIFLLPFSLFPSPLYTSFPLIWFCPEEAQIDEIFYSSAMFPK
jgi:hypothetical protein